MRQRKFPGKKVTAGVCENQNDAVSHSIRQFLVISFLRRSACVESDLVCRNIYGRIDVSNAFSRFASVMNKGVVIATNGHTDDNKLEN